MTHDVGVLRFEKIADRTFVFMIYEFPATYIQTSCHVVQLGTKEGNEIA